MKGNVLVGRLHFGSVEALSGESFQLRERRHRNGVTPRKTTPDTRLQHLQSEALHVELVIVMTLIGRPGSFPYHYFTKNLIHATSCFVVMAKAKVRRECSWRDALQH